ncbi:mannitol dehydrogenase family protein [Ruegeria sp.]|uniref:mannitol dehydrogenase family protein n=1 Tax=Ruegeria sp. TaxID=1879320 RepID=UPI003B5B493E
MSQKMPETLCSETLKSLNAGVDRPGYDASAHGIGIVHLGLGAFHRAHQAVYTDDALAQNGGDWRIMGVSMRSAGTANALTAQDGLYTLLQRGASGTSARIIASVAQALSLKQDRDRIVQQLCAPATKIISLTVTEKAYCFDPQTGALDFENADVVQDLKTPDQAGTVPGLLAQILKHRRDNSIGGLAIMSCDNLPNNGQVVRQVVMDFAKSVDAGLANWIDENVTFPSTMVDRITPQTTPDNVAEAQTLTGLTDAAPVQCEEFNQWVIEDNFPHGRPAWENAGAIFVHDVTPYEKMKLRMLNGSHSLLAYAGHVSGLPTIGDCMKPEALRAVLCQHLTQVSAGLTPLSGVDYATYADQLIARFDNPSIAHATYQIAMDGSQKMAQRIFEPAEEALDHGLPVETFAFATAVWLRYLLGRTEAGEDYALRDPKDGAISDALAGADGAPEILAALNGVNGLLPGSLFQRPDWNVLVTECLSDILENGVANTASALVSSAR